MSYISYITCKYMYLRCDVVTQNEMMHGINGDHCSFCIHIYTGIYTNSKISQIQFSDTEDNFFFPSKFLLFFDITQRIFSLVYTRRHNVLLYANSKMLFFPLNIHIFATGKKFFRTGGKSDFFFSRVFVLESTSKKTSFSEINYPQTMCRLFGKRLFSA